ncbi:MAG: T9SS type A sorting domain-containing protein [Bacteroidota bacterium]
MKTIILAVIAVLYLSECSLAQVSSYSHASSAGTYTEITGGTIVATATSASGAGSLDDVNYTVASGIIPFNFTFDGNIYTGLTINTNGYITFGATAPPTNGYTPISATTAYSGSVSAVGRDLNSLFNISGNTGQIRYETVGSAPNREFVVQYKNFRPYSTSTSTTVYWRWNFQIRLKEDNSISVVYNFNFVGAPAAGTGQVGLRGAVNSDYKNRTTTTNWSATTAGVVNTATCSYSTTIFPANGLTFTYTPPLINIPPNCATIVSPPDAATNVLSSATLNWVSGGGSPTGYKLSLGTDDPPTNIVSNSDLGIATSYTPSPALSYNTTYYWQVTAYNAYGDANGCSVWSFTTGPDPTITTFPACESFDGTTFAPYGWTNVNTSGPGTPGTWDRQTAGTNPTCTPYSGAGMSMYDSYTLESGTKGILVTPPINFPDDNYKVKFRMYRDAGYPTNFDLVNVYYNSTPDLTGTPALLGTINRAMGSTPVVATEGWYQYEYTMPSGAGGNGRFVVFEALSAYGNNIFLDDICLETDTSPILTVAPTSIDFGSVSNGSTSVEFTYLLSGINLTPASGDITITPPSNFEVSVNSGGPYSVTPITAAYTDGTLSETIYAVFKPTAPDTPYSGNISNAGGSATTVYVEVSGSSPCDLTIAPMTEDFESAAFPPSCWTNTAVSGSFIWLRNIAASGNGEGSASCYADFYNQTAGSIYELITTTFDISSLTNPALKFDYAYATYTGGEEDEMDVYYSVDNGSNWSSLILMPGGATGILNTGGTVATEFIPSALQWDTQILTLPAGTNRLKFTAISAYGNNLYLDNIQVYSSYAHDVSPISVDLNQIISTGPTLPQATLKNNGSNTETFTVNLTIGAYTSTRTVTSLTPGATGQVTFDLWNASLGDQSAQVCTQLGSDNNTSNDCISQTIKVLDLNKVVYGYNAFAGSGTDPIGPASFTLSDPGVINSIADQSLLQFMSGGTWANGIWYGTVYNTTAPYNFISIDLATGTRTIIGDMGIDMTGLCYNTANNTMYAVNETNLYTINMTTGTPTLVGSNPGIFMINLAINNSGQAYSLNITNDVLGTIDLTTGLFTGIGSIGFNANYAQDMEFDRESGELYMAAMDALGGWLSWVNPTTGTTLKIGDFEGGAEITGFAIPYIPEISLWTGAVNSEWANLENWNPPQVPSASFNVSIPDVTNDPVINEPVGSPAICNNLTIESGAVLSISAGKALTVNGILTNNSGSNGIVLHSDASGTGSLIHQSNDVVATVERYLNDSDWSNWQDGWHFLSSPVVAQSISPAFTTVPAENYDLYAWYEIDNLWVNFKNTGTAPTWSDVNSGSDNFLTGKGYLAAYDASDTKLFTGILNVSDVELTGLTISGSSNTNRSWHLLGNPFSSGLTWDASSDWDLINIAGVAKIWNEANQSYSDLTSSPSSEIPATNGFMISVTSGTGSLTLPASKRIHSGQVFYKAAEPGIVLTAINETLGNAQESRVVYNTNATSGFDFMFDSEFLAGYGPQFYSLAGVEKLSTNCLPSVTSEVFIPFVFIPNNGRNYHIKATGAETLGATPWLLDKKNNTDHNLLLEPVYTFSTDATDDPERFVLHFSPVGIEQPMQNSLQLAWFTEQFIYAETRCESTFFEVLDMQGKIHEAHFLKGKGIHKTYTDLPTGIYLIKLTSKENVTVSKIVIR